MPASPVTETNRPCNANGIPLLTVYEAAKVMGKSVQYVRECMRDNPAQQGKLIPSVKIGPGRNARRWFDFDVIMNVAYGNFKPTNIQHPLQHIIDEDCPV